MVIYNTLTKRKEPFDKAQGEKVNMFVCGPTVYAYIHVGNARTFVIFDVVAKYLKYKYGENNVTYIQNITDIDNKIIERAQQEGVEPLEYAEKYTKIFKEDMKVLGITTPEYKNATDHIPEVIQQVQTLLDKAHAYIIDGDGIYFDLSTFPDYGKLSGRTASMADDAISRIDDSDKKRNRGDFALWKFSAPNDPSWPAPFGEGRPGWHIEDTAITEKYFGPQYDIHGGGQDLIFPHHEAEIAQQESASGLKPFVKYWMHAGFLINKDSKMSKSEGNFLTLHEALGKYSPEALRFYFLSNHYRAPLEFNDSSFKTAQAAVERIAEVLNKLNLLAGKSGGGILGNLHTVATEDFKKAMDDDFNTPQAFAIIFDFIRNINGILAHGGLASSDTQLIRTFFNLASDVFGIVKKNATTMPTDIQELIDQRQTARDQKDFVTSDELREQIESAGYQVDDTSYGPLVKRIK